jgi:hypothetical protein
MIWAVPLPDLDPDFLPIPDPGGQKGIGSRIRNTGKQETKFMTLFPGLADPTEFYANYFPTHRTPDAWPG